MQDLKRMVKGLGAYAALFVGAFTATLLAICLACAYVAWRSGLVPCALAVVLIAVFSWLLNKVQR